MKRLLQMCSVGLVVLAIPLFSGCVGYVYDGGVGVGVGLGGGWSGGGYHGGGWGRGGGYGHGGGWGRGGGYGHGGGWGHGGRGGGYHGGRHAMSTDDFNIDEISESDSLLDTSITSAVSADSAVSLARDYEISVDSAQKILKVASGKVSHQSLKAVGLTAQDAKLIKRLEMPSDETIGRISNALGEDSWKIQRLVQGFVSDMQRQ